MSALSVVPGRGKTCEICGDRVVAVVKGEKCGHPVALCETCKKECPGTLRACARCENTGRW